MGLFNGKNREIERSRDITAALKAADQASKDQTPDYFGKRPQRSYEHSEIVMSNEFVAMTQQLDRDFEDFRAEFEKAEQFKNDLKAAMQAKVIDLTSFIERQKAIAIDLQSHFQDLQARVEGKRYGEAAPEQETQVEEGTQ